MTQHAEHNTQKRTKGLSVVLAEDEAISATAMRMELESLGYSVAAVAAKGRDAVEKIKSAAPDLIVLDVRLADDMSGVEVAQAVRAFTSSPIVFVTGYDLSLVPLIATIERSTILQKPVNARAVHDAAGAL